MEQFRFPNGPTVTFENRSGLRARKPAGTGLYYADYGNEAVNLRLGLMHMWSDLGCGNAVGCEEIAVDTRIGRVSFALRKLSRLVSDADISASADARPRYQYQALAMDKTSRGGSFLSVDIVCATRQACLDQITAMRSLRVVDR
ncbi:MAG TPA: hypothetical protein VF067_09145 [Sphingomicrobium sp.]